VVCGIEMPPADENAPLPSPLERRLAALLLGARGGDDDDHYDVVDREYVSEILRTLLDMADGSGPDDVAEYLRGFVVNASSGGGDGDGGGDLDEELRRFSLDVARYRAGSGIGEGEGIADAGTAYPADVVALTRPLQAISDGSAQQRVQMSGREEGVWKSQRTRTKSHDGNEFAGDWPTTLEPKSDPEPDGRGREDEHHEMALSTLQSMFTDMGYTTRHLDAVLRHHGRRIEDAVETILIHGAGAPDELLMELSSPPAGSVVNNGDGKERDKKRMDAAELTRHLFVDVRRRQADDDDYSASMSSRNGMGGGTGVAARRMDGMVGCRDVENDGGRRRYGGSELVGGGRRECQRSCIPIGARVYVVKKEDQRTGRETGGIVSSHLTNVEYHPRGIKVMLADGTVGRVIKFAR
jgi:uncharacterized repeat protein (TIGR03833 family)